MITYHLLFITPHSTDQNQVRQLLTHAPTFAIREIEFQVTCVSNLKEAIAKLSGQPFNVILLCLNLRESQGMETLKQCKAKVAHLPIIVFTGSKDEAVRVQSLQFGAQGYLVKDEIDSKLLVYSLRLAIEQNQQLEALKQNQLKQLQEEEFLGLQSLADTAKTHLTAKLFGLSLLREGSPDIFQEIVQQYGELMDLSLEQRAYRVEHNISEQLRNMGEQLGFLKASPRDIVDIHTHVLREKTQQVNPHKAQAYVSEGRLMVLELMGYLASYYRKYFIGLSKLNISKDLPIT